MISKEDALLIFNKWREEGTTLRVIAQLRALHLDSEAVLIGVSWDRFALRLPGEKNFVELDFADSAFNWGANPRAADESALVCLRSDGEIIFLDAEG